MHGLFLLIHCVSHDSVTSSAFVNDTGGFFASGFKRAFELKDFGDTIPGHGGITDRFDCQVGRKGVWH